jgi:hypothetical protein
MMDIREEYEALKKDVVSLKATIEALTETAKEANARAIKDHNTITTYMEALVKISKLNSSTTNYALARVIAQEAIDKAIGG